MKLNIGCGKRNFGHKWVHIDGASFSHIDSNDISLESFKNDSVDLIDHLMEKSNQLFLSSSNDVGDYFKMVETCAAQKKLQLFLL